MAGCDALHRKIARTLRRQILAGAYDDTAHLPDETTLAKRFGVSRTTISRVMLDLRTAGLIVTHAGTPARISRFARNATGIIGIIDPGQARGHVLSSVCLHMAKLAEQAGWHVLRRVLTAERPNDRAAEVLEIAHAFASQRVSGVLMQPLEFQKDGVRANAEVLGCFDASAMPVVLIDYDYVPVPNRSRYDLVSIDNVAAGQCVALRLIEGGAKRLGFILPPNAPASVVHRMHGVALAALDAGLEWEPSRQVLQASSNDRKAVTSFVRTARCDALVCGNDAAALRLDKWLSSLRRVKRPRLGGFDGLDAARRAGIVTVAQPCRDLAYVAVQTLLSRIKNPTLPTRTVCLGTEH